MSSSRDHDRSITAVTSGQSHSPGPWLVQPFASDLSVYAESTDQRLLRVAFIDTGYQFLPEGLGLRADEYRAAADAIRAANAHMVAAAPTMFDALLSARAWLDRWAEHVGACAGGDRCSCGLTAIRGEVNDAVVLADPPSSLTPT